MTAKWPYTRAMLRAKRRRELREWYNKHFTSDRIMTVIFVIFFCVMLTLHIMSPWR